MSNATIELNLAVQYLGSPLYRVQTRLLVLLDGLLDLVHVEPTPVVLHGGQGMGFDASHAWESSFHSLDAFVKQKMGP